MLVVAGFEVGVLERVGAKVVRRRLEIWVGDQEAESWRLLGKGLVLFRVFTPRECVGRRGDERIIQNQHILLHVPQAEVSRTLVQLLPPDRALAARRARAQT